MADVRSGQADVTVKTTLNGKSRDYIFHLTSGLGNSSLANLVVSTSNTFTDTSKYLTLSPVFDSTKTSYTVSYLADKEENKEKFLRLYVEPSDGDATVTVQKVKGVEKVSMPVVANGKTKRVNVYWETDASEAQVKITVTAAGSGKNRLSSYHTAERKRSDTNTYRSTGGVRTMENDFCSHGIFTGCTDAYQQQGPQGKEDRRQKTDTYDQGNGYPH